MTENGDAQERVSQITRFMRFLRAHGALRFEALESAQTLLQRQTANSVLNARFVSVLVLAGMIASLGLLANSAVVVVGAMLIAPLMKPILSLAYGLVVGNPLLVVRSLITLIAGIIATVAIAAATEQVFKLAGPTTEILARTEPSLIDLGVAVAAALAATIATSRPDVADSLPGVAIAVALVPPLCVTGIGVSTWNMEVITGSFLLFTVNLSAIVLFAGIIFLLDGYGSIRRAAPGLLLVAAAIGMQAPVLWGSLRQLQLDDHTQEIVEQFLREHYPENQSAHPSDLRMLDVIRLDDHVFVYIELEAPRGVFSAEQLRDLYNRIAAEVEMPLNLKMQYLLTDEFTIYEFDVPEERKRLYGIDEAVPRR